MPYKECIWSGQKKALSLHLASVLEGALKVMPHASDFAAAADARFAARTTQYDAAVVFRGDAPFRVLFLCIFSFFSLSLSRCPSSFTRTHREIELVTICAPKQAPFLSLSGGAAAAAASAMCKVRTSQPTPVLHHATEGGRKWCRKERGEKGRHFCFVRLCTAILRAFATSKVPAAAGTNI